MGEAALFFAREGREETMRPRFGRRFVRIYAAINGNKSAAEGWAREAEEKAMDARCGRESGVVTE